MSLTGAQAEAVAARGNVLVLAGAGTGKTSTLVERCLACLLDERSPASLDEILMVTFTDAAAAEMRQRIRARLEEKLGGHADDLRWQEQLALFEMAHIGTLHSFCLRLVRQHFHELGLDPQLNVMREEEARLLAEETLDKILRAHYAGDTELAPAVQQLVQSRGRGWDKPVRALVTRLHDYTQTLRDPEGWFTAQLKMFESPEPGKWLDWLVRGISEWRDRWQPRLATDIDARCVDCAKQLETLPPQPSRGGTADVLKRLLDLKAAWSAEKKARRPKMLDEFMEEAAFLFSLARTPATNDPLTEDWNWVRGQMTALLKLAREFTEIFSDAKRELGMLDFHDLEQHALRLLRDRETGEPTTVALHWRAKLRFVFVDEYQDINEAQDAILTALSREGAGANRFLVGDVKQSIYRFRLANPRIFLNYATAWRGKAGRTIALVENFRSHESILDFVNGLFGLVMRPEAGGVAYDDEARLRFGDRANRTQLTRHPNQPPRVEMMLRLRSRATEVTSAEGEGGEGTGNSGDAGREARMVALRLRAMKKAGERLWDEGLKAERAVDWRDMAVLLRSPSKKAEVFAREFALAGVPLAVVRSDFYASMEVADLLNLLRVLDNPLQDLPLLAVLRSPLVGLTLDELAAVRLALRAGTVWLALQRFHGAAKSNSGWAKVERFLRRYGQWRKLARQVSLLRCLETVLADTHYADWVQTQPQGEQRRANVRKLLLLAQQFDRFQRQGLYRFLNFVDAQQAAEMGPETTAASNENAVSLMSIHQSKGLEFPVVVVADLGKPFNFSDLNAEIILDEAYGLCPLIKPPHMGGRYPSLPWWLARIRQKQELLSEELRLLYVAVTRARERLILSGTCTRKRANEAEAAIPPGATELRARNYLDWILQWADAAGASEWRGELSAQSEKSGENSWWRWSVQDGEDAATAAEPAEKSAGENAVNNKEQLTRLKCRLAWQYPKLAETRVEAKASVTALRQQAAEEAEQESRPLFRAWDRRPRGDKSPRPEDRGTAHHKFMQFVSLKRVDSVKELRGEADRMVGEGVLSEEERGVLDVEAMAAFWGSELGQQIKSHEGAVRRELAFTARFSPEELGLLRTNKEESGEFVVVQGAADLAVILSDEIWLVDFKTDEIGHSELADRLETYQPQMRLYALALERIYGRRVSRAFFHFFALGKTVPVAVEQTRR